jgi:hypothetical protein
MANVPPISTRDLSRLPGPADLRALSQSLATLDAILSPEWDARYYSFNRRWGAGEAMASMRDGSGDGYFALFDARGAILKGFAHESPMRPRVQDPPRVWPGVLDHVPPAFAAFLTEPAFVLGETTFCVWWEGGDSAWRRGAVAYPPGTDPDGSASLLALLDGDPATYRAWAEEYYDQNVPLDAVVHVHRHRPLTPAVVAALNDRLALEDLAEDLDEIGYPQPRP